MIRAYATRQAKGKLTPFEYDPGELKPDQVEIDVIACGICHSDLSVLNNEWQNSVYPLVPGHEVVGAIAEVGGNVKHLRVGDTVGLGWFSGSCMSCPQCMGGDQNLCPQSSATIVGRHGIFADRVRCDWQFACRCPMRWMRRMLARCFAAA